MCVNPIDEVADIGPIAKRLNSAGRCTGADGHQKAALFANFLNSFGVVGRRDRTFHKADVVRPADLLCASLQKVRDVDRSGDGQQLIFGIQAAKTDSHRTKRI